MQVRVPPFARPDRLRRSVSFCPWPARPARPTISPASTWSGRSRRPRRAARFVARPGNRRRRRRWNCRARPRPSSSKSRSRESSEVGHVSHHRRVLHDDDPPGVTEHFIQLVGDQECRPALQRPYARRGQQLGRCGRIQRRGRLVEDHDLRWRIALGESDVQSRSSGARRSEGPRRDDAHRCDFQERFRPELPGDQCAGPLLPADSARASDGSAKCSRSRLDSGRATIPGRRSGRHAGGRSPG